MEKIKSIKAFISKWKYILTSEQKKKSVVVFVSILVSSVLELLGISMIIPFVTVLIDGTAVMENSFLNGFFSKIGITVTGNKVAILMAILMIAVFVIKDFSLILTEYISLKYENQIQKDFSVFMLEAYLKREYEDTLDINSAEVMRGIGNDVTALYYIIQSLFSIFTSVITIMLVGTFLVKTDPVMALGIVIITGGFTALTLAILKRRVKSYGKIFNESMVESNKHALQALNGIKEIMVMGRSNRFIDYYENAVEAKKKAQLKYRFLQSIPRHLIETIFIIGIVILVSVRSLNGEDLSDFLPALSAFAVASIRVLPLVNHISSSSTTILYYLPSFENAYTNIKSSREYLADKSNSKDDGTILEYKKEICLNNVTWKYKRAEKPTFEDVNIKISRGESVGIKGPSGAGKTTLADVILGLLPPSKGSVTIDGLDIFEHRGSWAEIIGYVPQNVFLLDDTIRNNILFGIDAKDYSEEKVLRALEEACLLDFVKSLPEGLDTMVGERGTKLSGGQRQRIAIARALYYNPQIIVLDEATSALDQDTEAAVMEAIERLQGSKTLIIIAHRLSTLSKCDKIYEVSNGSVFEKAT